MQFPPSYPSFHTRPSIRIQGYKEERCYDHIMQAKLREFESDSKTLQNNCSSIRILYVSPVATTEAGIGGHRRDVGRRGRRARRRRLLDLRRRSTRKGPSDDSSQGRPLMPSVYLPNLGKVGRLTAYDMTRHPQLTLVQMTLKF